MQENNLDIIKAMPKIELHRHLEGALRLESLIEIARDFDIEMPEYEVESLRPFVQITPGQPRTFQNFLGKFNTLRQFYLSPEIICRLAHEVIVDAALDNVKYMELRFTPLTLAKIIHCGPHDTIKWVCETAMQTMEDYDIDVKMIVSMNRHEDVKLAEEVTEAAIDLRELGIVALDLAGMEPGYSASSFRHVFRKGRDAGFNITLHAGEWDGAQSVWDAIGNVGAQRIGHGIRVIEDPGVLRVVRQRNVVLEVCPSSNIDSGAVADWDEHPLRRLIDAGVRCTINTDDPLVSDITLSDELYRATQHFGLSIDDIKQHTLIAAEAAFLEQEERKLLVDKFNTWLYPST